MKQVDQLRVTGGIQDANHLACSIKVMIRIHAIVRHSVHQIA